VVNVGEDVISVRGLTMGFGERVVVRDLDFAVRRGEVFVVMGSSGCGKTTLLRHLLGLQEPLAGEVRFGDESFTGAPRDERERLLRRVGVLFQGSALWSSMTLAENVALPLEQFTSLSAASIRSIVRLKLSLVGLRGFEDYFPWELSGGMQKRAGLARAISLDPEILFIDEPSASLDPPTARRLDALIAQLRDALGTTAVVVTHDVATILGIGTRALFLDGERQRAVAEGTPSELRERGPPAVRAFFGASVARP
jgi:phospholipid/cholesterol/gamma-HCH transport system ATP-binding protein